MAKKFAPRVSKRNRETIDLASKYADSLLKINDERLLRGAELQKVKLADIEVRKQVRTKFNDDSIAELAKNIKENGLIQPLVLHREKKKFVLICGERRFRAMSTIDDMHEAPCFILENKTDEELMAIQFSENSAREELHYIDQADSIYNYKKVTGASERKIQAALARFSHRQSNLAAILTVYHNGMRWYYVTIGDSTNQILLTDGLLQSINYH